MTPIEILALSRIVREAEEKLARGQVSPGTHSVDVVVHVSGLVEVEKDYEKRPTVSVPWTEAYALLREVAIRGVNDLIARMDRGEMITREEFSIDRKTGAFIQSITLQSGRTVSLIRGYCGLFAKAPF